MVVRVRLGSTDACASSGYGLANETKATSVAKQSSGVWQSKKSNLLHVLEQNSIESRTWSWLFWTLQQSLLVQLVGVVDMRSRSGGKKA